jgi:hypothetical protein
MKTVIQFSLGIVFVFGIFLFTSNLSASTFKAEAYKEVQSKALKLQAEEYRNKKVFYTGLFTNILTTFPSYADKSGIKAGKYFWLVITPRNVPVVARKGKDLDAMIMAIKRGSTVKVYGKIKKFKYKPRVTMLPPYYLELANIEVIKEPEKELSADNKDKINFRKKWKNRRDNRKVPPPQPPE